MTWALQLMAVLSILAGLVILYCVVREKHAVKAGKSICSKFSGVPVPRYAARYGLSLAYWEALPHIIGCLLSLATSYLLSVQVFDRVWSFRWDLPLLIVLSVTTLCIITADFGACRILRERPARLLQEG